MHRTARELAALVSGQLDGDDVAITGVSGIREAETGDLTFISAPRYAALAAKTRASVILVAKDFRGNTKCPLIRVEKPMAAFTQIAALFAPPPVQFAAGIHPTAVIAPTAKLGAGVSIQPHAVIEDRAEIGDRTVIGANCYIGHEARIGADCFLYPLVSIRERCVIGKRVMIHCGTVIGADGFGYETTPQGPKKIPQTGIVEVADDAEIGANTCIDRARFGKTRIGRNVKIDNLVQVGHNVVIGDHSVICGQTGIAGSTVLGMGVTTAAQVGISGHLEIGSRAIIEAKSGVAKDVPPGERWLGPYAALPLKEAMRTYAALLRLPQLTEMLKDREKSPKE